MRKVVFTVAAAACLISAMPEVTLAAPGNKVDADPAKRYRLSRRHGPWMIMVASLRDVPEEMRRQGGLSAQEAADEIVLALRREGIPAYTFSQRQVIDQIRTANRRTGENVERSYVAQQDRVVVVAGNYRSAQSKVAQHTLKKVKGEKLIQKVKVLQDGSSGAVYKRTSGRPHPLARAFLMPNPLLKPEELKSNKRDPLLLNLNGDMEHSLTRCPGKYSLVIATFRGKSNMHINKAKLDKSAAQLDKKLGTTLDEAGLNAWRLTKAMRMARKLGYEQDYEAYIYHDRYQSIVTVGSFDSPTDPRARALAKKFAAKPRAHPKTGTMMLAGEIFSVPKRPRNRNGIPDYTWIFDPKPELIEVPRLK